MRAVSRAAFRAQDNTRAPREPAAASKPSAYAHATTLKPMVDFVPPPSFALPPELPFTRQALDAADALFPYSQEHSLEQVTRLRAQGFTPDETANILSLVKARTRALSKFGDRARTMFLTEHGAQQATRPVVAAEHAAVFARAGVRSVADLGCGIGADSLEFARASLATVSVELDPLTASFAAANLADFSGSRVVVGDVTNFDPESFRDGTGEAVQGIWLDPARRDLTGVVKSRTERIFDPEAYSPPLSFVVDLARTGMPMGVKLGPGMPHEAIVRPEDIRSEANPHPCVTAQWVEHEGSLVELVLWFNALAQEGVARTVTVLRQEATGQAEDKGLCIHKTTLSSPHSAEQVTPVEQEQTRLPSPGEYLYEPSGAVVRAHLVQELAQELGANLIDPHLAYLTAAKAVQSPLAQCYEVLEEIPVHEKQLKKWVRERGFTALTIKKRGVDLVPEKLRATLLAGGAGKKSGKKAAKNQGYNPATLVFTRVGSGQRARRIGWHVRPVDFSDAAQVSASDTKNSVV